jgi:amino acid transporter
MATIPRTAKSRQSLQHGQLGLFGVIMPGVAQVAPAFNLFFTTGLMVSLAGASAPLIFLISMVGMVATASSLAQFASIYPSAGSFITYITRAIGTKVAVAVGGSRSWDTSSRSAAFTYSSAAISCRTFSAIPMSGG